MRIRVAQIVTRFIAGAGGVALRGALALDPSRYAVTIVAGGGGPLLSEAARAGFDVVELDALRPDIDIRADLRSLAQLSAWLRANPVDVVHTHSSKAGALGRVAAHRAGVRAVVHTFHGFPFHPFQSWPRRRLYITIERRLGRITDEFLGVGTAVAAEAVRLGIAAPDRMRAIASAISPGIVAATPASRERARRLMGLPGEAPVIGSVGRLDRQKAPQDLVAAVAAMRRSDLHTVWIGDGPMRDAVQRQIQDAGLTDRFHLLGERDDVYALLPGLDLFAMSSLYEGLPCAVAEAMSCGIPVVATAVNAVPEVVIPGKTGLLAPAHAPNALAAALGYMLEHPTDAARMAIAARDHIGDRFEVRHLGEALTQTYERALSRTRMARPAGDATANPFTVTVERGPLAPSGEA